MHTRIKLMLTGLLAAGLALTLPTLGQRPSGAAFGQYENDEAKTGGPKSISEVPADQKVIYLVEFKGEIGRAVSAVSVRTMLEDAKRWNPDYLVFRVNMPYLYQGRPIAEWQKLMEGRPLAGQAFNGLETVRELQTMFTDGIRDDPNWKTRDGKKPELVMWVKEAMGGAAFLPFVAQKIYYTADAHHGGIGYLEFIFNHGDRVVWEKQFSLRLGRAEGLVIKGGHAPELIKAMARMDYVLSVSYVGGKPVYFPDDGGDELLTDDGNADAGRRDDIETIIRNKGNDCLTLDTLMRSKLDLCKAVVDSVEITGELGCPRNSVIVSGKSSEIFKKWLKDVVGAERELNALNREFNDVRVEGATAAERNTGRAKQLRILKRMLEIWKKYEESISGGNVRDVPGPGNIEIGIEQVKQLMRQDR